MASIYEAFSKARMGKISELEALAQRRAALEEVQARREERVQQQALQRFNQLKALADDDNLVRGMNDQQYWGLFGEMEEMANRAGMPIPPRMDRRQNLLGRDLETATKELIKGTWGKPLAEGDRAPVNLAVRSFIGNYDPDFLAKTAQERFYRKQAQQEKQQAAQAETKPGEGIPPPIPAEPARALTPEEMFEEHLAPFAIYRPPELRADEARVLLNSRIEAIAAYRKRSGADPALVDRILTDVSGDAERSGITISKEELEATTAPETDTALAHLLTAFSQTKGKPVRGVADLRDPTGRNQLALQRLMATGRMQGLTSYQRDEKIAEAFTYADKIISERAEKAESRRRWELGYALDLKQLAQGDERLRISWESAARAEDAIRRGDEKGLTAAIDTGRKQLALQRVFAARPVGEGHSAQEVAAEEAYAGTLEDSLNAYEAELRAMQGRPGQRQRPRPGGRSHEEALAELRKAGVR